MKQWIVNADDYGRTPGVSAGIRAAHLHGLVTSTTSMANYAAEEDLQRAVKECPDLGLGVHLTLTSGSPLLPAGQIPTLVDGNGCFKSLLDATLSREAYDPLQVKAEWGAQVERFTAITGHKPDHLDSHHHFSYFTAGLFAVMVELAAHIGCPVRNPVAVLAGSQPIGMPEELIPDMQAFMPPLLERHGVRWPAYFSATWYDGDATLDELTRLAYCTPDGVLEVMCHPAYLDQPLLNTSGYAMQRASELDILTDPRAREILRQRDINLATFAAI